jgi:hypothetical protein
MTILPPLQNKPPSHLCTSPVTVCCLNVLYYQFPCHSKQCDQVGWQLRTVRRSKATQLLLFCLDQCFGKTSWFSKSCHVLNNQPTYKSTNSYFQNFIGDVTSHPSSVTHHVITLHSYHTDTTTSIKTSLVI